MGLEHRSGRSAVREGGWELCGESPVHTSMRLLLGYSEITLSCLLPLNVGAFEENVNEQVIYSVMVQNVKQCNQKYLPH